MSRGPLSVGDGGDHHQDYVDYFGDSKRYTEVGDHATQDVCRRGGPCKGADAFECAGVNAVLDTMLDSVRPGAVVVNVSSWGAPATVDMQKLVLKEIDLRGTIAYVRDHPAVIRVVQEGKVTLKPFITGRIALEDLVEQGFDTLTTTRTRR